MFHGEYTYSLDEKGRVIVPKAHRDALADGLYITRGLEGCVWIFTLQTWSGISEEMARSGLGTRTVRALDRVLYTGSEQRLDNQSRVTVPDYLRTHGDLELGAPVTVLGVKNRLELWSAERWRVLSEQLMSELDDDLGKLAL